MVANPAPADCDTTEAVYVEIVPAPTLTAVAPELECDEQGDQAFVLSGAGFVALADGTLPTVTMGAYAASALSASDCVVLSGTSGASSCETLAFSLPAGSLGAGVVDVVVANPAPADCDSSEVVSVEIVPAPTLASVASAERVCVEQSERTVDLVGTGFVALTDGTLPSLDLSGDAATVGGLSACTALSGPAGGQSCSELTATLAAGSLSPGVKDIVLANPAPADCDAGGLRLRWFLRRA